MKKEANNFKLLEENIIKRNNVFAEDYNKSKEKVEAILKNYSIKDILYSLFSLSLWLKNVTAPVRMQWIYMIFLSIDKSQFKQADKVIDYKSYQEFVSQLIHILPEFNMLEDYIPEPDWGEIKYCVNDINYKIFYGSDLDGTYEFLDSFQLIHCSLDDIYLKVINRSPKFELEQCLILQQGVIDNLKNNCTPEEVKEIPIGNVEIPIELFWRDCIKFYDLFNFSKIPSEFLKTYSCELGQLNQIFLDSDNFIEDYYLNEKFRFLFIKSNGKFYPILPRRFILIIIESWGRIFNENISKIKETEPNINLIHNLKLCSYIQLRNGSQGLFKIVSPFDIGKGISSDSIYSCAFLSKNDLYLIYLLEPSYGEIQINERVKSIKKIIDEDLKILTNVPTTLLMRLEEQNNMVSFGQFNDEQLKFKPKILLVLPRLRISLGLINSEDIHATIITLEDLLGIFDEIENFNVVSDFLNFVKDPIINSPFNSFLDQYGAFKDSLSIINPGASKASFISILPLYGSSFRYKSLKDFWENYPEINFINNPRNWEIVKDTHLTRLRSKNERTYALYTKVGNSNIFINAPFLYLNFEQARITNLIMEIIEDGLIMYKDELKNLNTFEVFRKIHIFVFPFEEDIVTNPHLTHLNSSNPLENPYLIEHGFPEHDVLGIRLSFNYNKVFEALSLSDNRSFEIELIKDILNTLNKLSSNNISTLLSTIEKDIKNPPRFKINVLDKQASFPELAIVVEPEQKDFKFAKKTIAEIAFEKNIKAGHYGLKDGKIILNSLKKGLVDKINEFILNFSFENSIKYLISKTDALVSEYESKKMVLEESIKHDVDYVREERYASNQIKYTKYHRNYRYLIEKFVLLSPQGSNILNEEDLKMLLGLVDWLHVIQSASDSIHYDIWSVGVDIEEDFQLDVKYDKESDSNEKIYSEEEARINLEIIGNPEDLVNIKKNILNYTGELDKAFISDFGFSLINLFNVLDILTYWPEHCKDATENEYYVAGIEKIFDVTSKAIKSEDFERSEFNKIIDFLTLDSNKIMYLLGSNEPCLDIPIWEHNKRPMRYNLRPLIKLQDNYIWGAFSAKKTSEIWKGNLSLTTFPYDLQSTNLKKIIDKERENISNELTCKAEEIIKRFTNFTKKEFDIFKLERTNFSLQKLGDYDVLAFLPNHNIILNVECKELKPPFCLKDAMSLREKLFGKNEKDKGYFEKVVKREEYLIENSEFILKKLNWTYNINVELKIVSIFLIRRNYWWTKFPPFDTEVVFLRVDLLEDFIKGLNPN